MQEFEYTIEYRSGEQKGNADALSRRATHTTVQSAVTQISTSRLHTAQQQDPMLSTVHQALNKSLSPLVTLSQFH